MYRRGLLAPARAERRSEAPSKHAGGQDGDSQDEAPRRRRGRPEDLLPGSGGRRGAGAALAARVSDVVPHVPRPDSGLGGRLPSGRPRPPGFRLFRGSGPGAVQIHLRSRRRGHGTVHDGGSAHPSCDLRLRLRCAGGLPPRDAPTGPNHCDHLAEWHAYEDGLSEGWNPIQRYWKEPTSKNRAALRNFLTPELTRWQYTHGVQDESLIAPEGYTLDSALLARPGNDEIQLDLFLDYASNVALYPKFQEYFRTHRPPLLAVWGKNDPFFLPSGAEAFKRDNPGAVVRFFDTGHFALETHAAEIAAAIRTFLAP